MKVFYVHSLHEDKPPTHGETDGKLYDQDYLKVNGQLIHSAFVFDDTPENMQRLNAYRAEYKAWQALEPNMYALLNQMQRPGRH